MAGWTNVQVIDVRVDKCLGDILSVGYFPPKTCPLAQMFFLINGYLSPGKMTQKDVLGSESLCAESVL